MSMDKFMALPLWSKRFNENSIYTMNSSDLTKSGKTDILVSRADSSVEMNSLNINNDLE